jgi:hypothetical protein
MAPTKKDKTLGEMIQEFLKYSGYSDDDGSFSRIVTGTADKQAAFDLLFAMIEPTNKINITGDSVYLRPYLTEQYLRGQHFLRTVRDMMDKLSNKIAEESSCFQMGA